MLIGGKSMTACEDIGASVGADGVETDAEAGTVLRGTATVLADAIRSNPLDPSPSSVGAGLDEALGASATEAAFVLVELAPVVPCSGAGTLKGVGEDCGTDGVRVNDTGLVEGASPPT